MIDNADDLRKKAVDNKQGLKKFYPEYGFKISGIGEKSVKFEKFIKYEEILEIAEADENSIETMNKQIIEDYEEDEEEE